tara:strand:- start:626 stop:1198 length:573 start_codon:yes stop_codon:yes gene_type:complete
MNNQKEEFRDIPNYEGFYQVSNLGRVKSLKRSRIDSIGRKQQTKEIFLKPRQDKDGYLIVSLCSLSNKKTKSVHQLVAITFLNHTPNGINGLVVDHRDNNKLNNNINNLRLTTQRDNTSKDKIGASGLVGVCWHKATCKWLTQIIINTNRIHLGLFVSKLDASKMYQKALLNLDKYNGNNSEFRNYLNSL